MHNEEHRNFHSAPNIIRIIEPRRMRLERHVARMGRRKLYIGFWWENWKERHIKKA
jgi:hypothetical protein